MSDSLIKDLFDKSIKLRFKLLILAFPILLFLLQNSISSGPSISLIHDKYEAISNLNSIIKDSSNSLLLRNSAIHDLEIIQAKQSVEYYANQIPINKKNILNKKIVASLSEFQKYQTTENKLFMIIVIIMLIFNITVWLRSEKLKFAIAFTLLILACYYEFLGKPAIYLKGFITCLIWGAIFHLLFQFIDYRYSWRNSKVNSIRKGIVYKTILLGYEFGMNEREFWNHTQKLIERKLLDKDEKGYYYKFKTETSKIAKGRISTLYHNGQLILLTLTFKIHFDGERLLENLKENIYSKYKNFYYSDEIEIGHLKISLKNNPMEIFLIYSDLRFEDEIEILAELRAHQTISDF